VEDTELGFDPDHPYDDDDPLPPHTAWDYWQDWFNRMAEEAARAARLLGLL